MKFYRKGWIATEPNGHTWMRTENPTPTISTVPDDNRWNIKPWIIRTPGWRDPPPELVWKQTRSVKIGPCDPEGLSTENRYERAAWREEWQAKLAIANNCDHTICSQGDGVWYVDPGSYEQWYPENAFRRRCDAETYIAQEKLNEGWPKYPDFDTGGIDSEPSWLDF